ncbi:hypothetical protein EMN47_03350 [Prolixibacteraceae bacterium JC049]|nr:hypothetical protein [Prolixibacteraceae bacterium JC049]
MNCEKFDSAIKAALSNYGPLGVDVKLMFAQDTVSPNPPYDWYKVCLQVTPVVLHPETYFEIWNYGGLITHRKIEHLEGCRPINQNRIVSACKAAQQLPPGFPLPEANCELYWPIYPGVNEPIYSFHTDNVCIQVGAYTCQILQTTDTKQPATL